MENSKSVGEGWGVWGETSLMSYMVKQAELQPVCTLGRVVYTATWGWSWDTVNDKDLGMGRDGVA